MTEDRKGQGLLLGMSCAENITITDLAKISRHGILERDAERSAAPGLVEDLRIKTPSIDQTVRNFSGGNQQKVVIAKWLFRGSKVLLCDEPTRGIDVGARVRNLRSPVDAGGGRPGRPVHLVRPAGADRHFPPHHRVREGQGGRRSAARRVRSAPHPVDGLRGIWTVSGVSRGVHCSPPRPHPEEPAERASRRARSELVRGRVRLPAASERPSRRIAFGNARRRMRSVRRAASETCAGWGSEHERSC